MILAGVTPNRLSLVQVAFADARFQSRINEIAHGLAPIPFAVAFNPADRIFAMYSLYRAGSQETPVPARIADGPVLFAELAVFAQREHLALRPGSPEEYCVAATYPLEYHPLKANWQAGSF